MTLELKPGLLSDEFVSGGPRNYTYGTVNPATGKRETVWSVENINYNASKLLNFDVIRDMIVQVDESENVTLHTENKIKRKRASGRIDIITEPQDNMYRVSFLRDGGYPTTHPFLLAI
jgi:hypothetical protein